MQKSLTLLQHGLFIVLDSSDTQLDLTLLELSSCLAIIVSFVPSLPW